MTALGMKAGETCNFFGCSGVMKFKSIEYHELDRKIVEKCDLCECPTCGVLALSEFGELENDYRNTTAIHPFNQDRRDCQRN